ncbi:putative uncharacterized protein [Mycolicibacterium fortuitum subsp. acetamidolyticum]|uniref:AB hydrolase-1 domain-containing protein n=1 Tax=Mycolicibacterium fortuitum subsp. acetamidolyticum TaxID=144550 RepID=A0A117IF72_MYCFO|nr:alpha/beta fold hydrolase [Mycolicibacterium fortuitum]MCV7143451.1 alpha/beta hydrolase [Mycolicibacterium fortuitum]GAT03821.1 putative uncharacterized protein [Mycolicibacterium fortuitum subsp. acetamidolyticum]
MRLVFVHGIGGRREPQESLRSWSGALARGMQEAGHSAAADQLLAGRLVDARFAYYGDLFHDGQSQGGTTELDEASAETVRALLLQIIDAREVNLSDTRSRNAFRSAKAQLTASGTSQGVGNILRRCIGAATTVLSASPLRNVGQWASGALMVRDLGQVARYFDRRKSDGEGMTLADHIQRRVLDAIDDEPAIVIAHSLGSIVAFETLHRAPANVPLLATVGSPLGMRAVVWPNLEPQPPFTPPLVSTWLNYWDRDDIFAVRPLLEDCVLPNSDGVCPRSTRVDSDGFWVHSATKYLAQGVVGGKVAEMIQTVSSGN